MADGTVFWAAIGAVGTVGSAYVAFLTYRHLKQADGDKARSPGPGTLPLPNLPDAGRPVVGRREDLLRLRKILRPGPLAWLRGRGPKRGAVVFGHGGFGKSTLARHYWQNYGRLKFRRGYAGTIWLDADDPGRLLDQVHALCGYFGEPIPEKRSVESARLLLARLAETGKRFLLIFDNVDAFAAIKDLLPPPESRIDVIVTTRHGSGWQGFGTLELAVLDFSTEDAPAVDLLMQESGRTEDRAGARDLVEALGGLPLALVVAGAIAKRSGESWAEIAAQIDRVIDTAPKNEAYADSVIGAVALSHERLPPDAQMVAEIFAWWAPEGLSAELLTEAPSGAQWTAVERGIPQDVRDLAKSPERVRAALEVLEDGSLLRREGAGFALHRMSAAALRAIQMQAELPKGGVAVALLAAVYPSNVGASGNWPLCRALTPHVRALLVSGQHLAVKEIRFLLNQSALFLDRVGVAETAVVLARGSLEFECGTFPDSGPEAATGHSNLGLLLARNGNLTDGEKELRKALELRERYQPGSISLATTHNSLGYLLLERNEFRSALREFQKSATLIRRNCPRHSVEYAVVMTNIGIARYYIGQVRASFRLQAASLKILLGVLPKGDERACSAITSFGALVLQAGEAGVAEQMLEAAVDLRRDCASENEEIQGIRGSANWLALALLVRAQTGEETARREAEARALCDEFGFDFEERQRRAAGIAYTPEAARVG